MRRNFAGDLSLLVAHGSVLMSACVYRGRSHFEAKASEAAEILKGAGAFDDAHGDRLITVLAWNRLEQLAVWAVGGTAEGVDMFLTRMPRKCKGAK